MTFFVSQVPERGNMCGTAAMPQHLVQPSALSCQKTIHPSFQQLIDADATMRLLDVRTLKLRTFYGDEVPPYAILSHTWLRDKDEVTHAQIQDPGNCRNMLGFQKIRYACQQAIKDSLDHVWIDTCCIDKTNSTELSEAINSMFR
jgi:hypothetical protein